MRILDIRRHSLTKKGPGRGQGSHLSPDGVRLARAVGDRSDPYDTIVVSGVSRALETAIAMGFAVDVVTDALGPEDPRLFTEIGHHHRWSWEHPFPEFARLVGLNGPSARLGHIGARAWRDILASLPDNGRALAISHGRVIECAAVTVFPRADHIAWGPPFLHCEGIRVNQYDDGELRYDLLRVDRPLR